jgi:FKBP-type peptidyl-prolyl cis-trans isomerase 2
MKTIANTNDFVEVHYTGTLHDGTIFDSSRDREPLAFQMGAGQMIPGFEGAVLGMTIKDVKTVTIPAGEAYGEVIEEMIQEVPRAHLPEGLEPHVGQQLSSRMADGQEILLKVTDVQENHIVVDANHPLAGEALTFEIELVSVN